MVDYENRPQYRCHTCNSPYPESHPSMGFEGEVEICVDDYHLIRTAANRPSYIQGVLDKRAEMSAPVDRLARLIRTATDLQILPADGRELPYADGWRIVRSIIGERREDDRLLWARVPDGRK